MILGRERGDHRIEHAPAGRRCDKVVIAANERALAVPRSALSSFAGVTKLFVVEEGVAREREVRVGVDLGDGWVEVVQGVAQGKQVATSGLAKLADGTEVVIRSDVPPGA